MKSHILKYILPVLGVFISVFMLASSGVPCYASSSYYSSTASGDYYYSSAYSDATVSYVATCTCDDSYNIYFYRADNANNHNNIVIRVSAFDSSGNVYDVNYSYTVTFNSSSGEQIDSASNNGATSGGYPIFIFDSEDYNCSVYVFDSYADALADAVSGGDGTAPSTTIVDSSAVPVPQGNLYLNSTSTSTTDDRYYQGIELTNYNTSYEVVIKTRYTIPTYATLKFVSTYKGSFSVLTQYTSDVYSDDGITFADSSSAYFNFYDQLQTSYYDQFWDSSSSDYLAEDVELVVYRQDGTVGSSAMGYNQFVGLDDPAQNATTIKNVSSQFVGKEIWLAYKTLDSDGNTVISEYTKFIVYPLTSCSYNRISGYYTWDSDTIVSGVSYESVSSGSVGSESIYETPAEESNASGSSNLYNTDSESVSVDVNDVVDGMTSLTSLMGSVPGWFAYIFGFLPTWLITLISIGIAWAIIVGMIKLLKW